MYINIELSLKPNFMSSFFYESSIFLNISITLETLNLPKKSPNTFDLYIFGLKCCRHP